MGQPITVNVDLPSDNSDCLSGTLLDPIPAPGVLIIFFASSQRDGILTVTQPGSSSPVYNFPPILRSSGIPDVQTDIPVVVPVSGGRCIIKYDEVTAGDAYMTLIFVPMG